MRIFHKKLKLNILKPKRIKFLNYYFLTSKRFLQCMHKVYGINYFMSMHVLRMLGYSYNLKFGQISPKMLKFISDFFINYFLVERGLKKHRSNLWSERKDNGVVSAFRLFKGLPVNGQRTHSNGKTIRKMLNLTDF